MTADAYLKGILYREQVNTGLYSPVRGCQTILAPIIGAWSSGHLAGINPSGSFAKGTANKSGTDIDLFISLADTTPDTLQHIYTSLAKRMEAAGYTARRQNVSIGVKVNGYDVDLVPARRQAPRGEDHSLWRNRAGTWTKTNVSQHISIVSNSGRLDEVRVLKLWRNQKSLDFPSFYLELATIDALYGCQIGNLASNVMTAFEYLRDTLPSARIVDPANTNNILSDDLSAEGKRLISAAAGRARSARDWNEIIR